MSGESPTSPPEGHGASPVRWWGELTTLEVKRVVSRDPVLILPLAALEQHGPHLPLSTDEIIGRGLLEGAFRALSPELPVWSLPVQSLGASAEHEAFSGTVSLDAGELERLVVSVGEALARAGARRLVLANSHGGNRHMMQTAALRLRRDQGLLVVTVSYPRLPRPGGIDLPEEEWRHGLHGGALETAMMLHLRPDLVRKDRLRPAPSLGEELETTLERLGAEGAAAFAWLAGDLHPSGVTGDPTLATPAMGRVLVEHYGNELARVVRDARAFPLERLR